MQVTPNTTPYKPSPLSFGSPRTSPFRRPSSTSPSTVLHPHTPGSSPGRGYTPIQSPSKLNQSHTAEDGEVFTSGSSPIPAPKFRDLPESPTREATSQKSYNTMMAKTNGDGAVDNDSLEKLRPAQLREMREAFQALDRDSDGQVNRDDVADILLNLGKLGFVVQNYLIALLRLLLGNRSRLLIFGNCPIFSPWRSSVDQPSRLPQYTI